MGDYESIMPSCEREQHVIAAAQHIVKALEATKYLSNDVKKLLIDLESHLAIMTVNIESKEREILEVEERLKNAKRKITSWESKGMMIWDSGPQEASEYLEAVNEIQILIEGSRGLSVNRNSKQKELLGRAESCLQMAMSRLGKELIHILVQHKHHFEPKYEPSHCRGENVVYDESFVSVDDVSVENEPPRNDNESDEYVVALVHASVVPDIKSIANVMFASNYGREFCEAFIGVRKETLNQCLATLEMGELSIEDVLKMEWTSMSTEMKKWTWALKIIIRVYLASEKRLCDQVLGDFASANPFCFLEISKASVLCLLNFGEAAAMGPHPPEKLFCLLDMYEALSDLLLEIDTLFSEEAGSFVRIEFHELISKLANSARAALNELGISISSNASVYPLPGAGIHPLNKYVMNYIRIFPEYVGTLNLLLKDEDPDVESPVSESQNGEDIYPSASCPMSSHLQWITTALEFSLHGKSRLYKQDALRHIFLMNNIHYMVQKVKCSELRSFFGNEWIRKHNAKFQQHAMNYGRVTWSPILALLKDDGNPGSSSMAKATLKERCKGFSIAFGEVYKSQTQWCIPDTQLREDLRISTSLSVIHAYRSFLGRLRSSSQVGDKYAKYTPEELEAFLLDLFEGSPRVLRSSRRW